MRSAAFLAATSGARNSFQKGGTRLGLAKWLVIWPGENGGRDGVGAVAVAGGFSSTAKTQVFLYHRSQAGWIEAKELKLKDILHGKNVSEDVSIRPGDMIFVPEKTITKVRKYIPYSVGSGLGLNPASL